MTVLRSREVKPINKNSPNSKPIKQQPRVSSIEPKTPSNFDSNSSNSDPMDSSSVDRSTSSGNVRRSLRLASKSSSIDVKNIPLVSSCSSRKRKSVLSEIDEDDKLCGNVGEGSEGGVKSVLAVVENSLGSEGKVELESAVVEDSLELDSAVVENSVGSEMECDSGGDEVSKKGKGKRKLGFGFGELEGGLKLRSGKKVAPRGFVQNVEGLENDLKGDNKGDDNRGEGELMPSCDNQREVDLEKAETSLDADNGLNAETMSISDKGDGRLGGEEKGKGKLVDMAVEVEGPTVKISIDDNAAVKKGGSQVSNNCLIGVQGIADRYKAIMAKRNNGFEGKDNVVDALNNIIANLPSSGKVSRSNKGKGIVSAETVAPSDVGTRRLSRKEKGKGKLPEIVVEPGAVKVEISNSGNDAVQYGMPEAPRAEISNSDNVAVPDGTQVPENNAGANATRTRDRYHAIARRNASKFAFFSTAEEEQNDAVDGAETEMAPREMNSEKEDWPGPFSTAMKIIRERGKNVNLQENLSLDKETLQVMWVPKQEKDRKRSNLSVPTLQELCMTTLTKNADAITSLDYVPDVLRHKLSHMLCDMRKMNSHFLELLVRGSPAEIRVRDCSWLSEEDFTKIFKGAGINDLAVLQLDQCGRCMPDYILYATLARSPNSLPLLTTLSLKGACRLSDIGLSSLLSSAPALRSINLCQCSLLTSVGISSIADSLGSVLRELYVDDCESIDPILMLPALSKLESLEVLSLANLHTVGDDFICQLIALRGHRLKELVLANCLNLTDSSIKVISESCTGICALDLTNLCKLTDSALGYLANGCQFIRSLKLHRNIFSDEAIAAYLEISGGSLEDLALNNVRKVAYNTAISLSKCSKNLQNLDLSFCRNLSDEAVGLIADSCLSLKTLKLFGCTQITDVFLDGHSNQQVQVIGLQMTPILGHIKVPELLGPLRYSSVSS